MKESHEMIVKLGEELNWGTYIRNERLVKAVRMTSDFMVETSLGYLQGKRGDFIVEVGPRIRFPCAEQDFLDAYVAVKPYGGDRRVEERRTYE